MAIVHIFALVITIIGIVYVIKYQNHIARVKTMVYQREVSSIEPSEKTTKDESNRLVVRYRNKSYDLTKFAIRHPGGKEILWNNNGTDIEKLMTENKHSKHAYKMLDKYLVKSDPF